jgi:hypothetical protein
VKEGACTSTQHGVPTDHLADIDGPNVRHHQPRLWYAGAKNKFIAESRQHIEGEICGYGGLNRSSDHYPVIQHGWSQLRWGSGDPSAEHGMHKHQHHARAHSNKWEIGFKLKYITRLL